jgi:hypothetical protein
MVCRWVIGLSICCSEVNVECWCRKRGEYVIEREKGLFTWVGCVSLFTSVIFAVLSVTFGVWLFTFEGAESFSSVVVPACTFSSLGCSNIGQQIGSMRLSGYGGRGPCMKYALGCLWLHRSSRLPLLGALNLCMSCCNRVGRPASVLAGTAWRVAGM